MDATAVAATRGLVGRRAAEALLLPALFGGFQAAMAAVGWLGGRWAGPYIARWDHWVAFGLLAAIGGKMIAEAVRGGDGGPAARPDAGFGQLVVLAVATSIDALAAGLTLDLVGAPPAIALALIGGVTAALTALGYGAGRVAGRHLGKRLEIVGGVVLIGIGIEILVEHL